jgi:hypothetical protein
MKMKDTDGRTARMFHELPTKLSSSHAITSIGVMF